MKLVLDKFTPPPKKKRFPVIDNRYLQKIFMKRFELKYKFNKNKTSVNNANTINVTNVLIFLSKLKQNMLII